MFILQLPIGDWSNDGHGQCEYYTVISNKDASYLYNLNKRYNEEVYKLEELFSGYGQNYIDEAEAKKLPESYFGYLNSYDEDTEWSIEPYNLAELWVSEMTRFDENLQLFLLPALPNICVSLGYGLFSG